MWVAAMLSLVAVVGAIAAAMRMHLAMVPAPPIVFAPTVVYAVLRLEGALVRGASREWALHAHAPLRYGDPVPVVLTAYCLKGRTRRDGYVRQGIVAADPKLFPLARYLEIYVGRTYFGRFLIDDTGLKIKGNRLDIWTTTCSEARRFGRQRGTAVLVPRTRGVTPSAQSTGRIGGITARR
jgi:3D (Asp-Asp-Asp) domain-containing protein